MGPTAGSGVNDSYLNLPKSPRSTPNKLKKSSAVALAALTIALPKFETMVGDALTVLIVPVTWSFNTFSASFPVFLIRSRSACSSFDNFPPKGAIINLLVPSIADITKSLINDVKSSITFNISSFIVPIALSIASAPKYPKIPSIIKPIPNPTTAPIGPKNIPAPPNNIENFPFAIFANAPDISFPSPANALEKALETS